jgi:hypothetical protein
VNAPWLFSDFVAGLQRACGNREQRITDASPALPSEKTLPNFALGGGEKASRHFLDQS